MASVITYWQESLRLAGDVGVCAEASGLPQDEATAAVVIAAILARHFGQRPSALACAMYRAELVTDDGSSSVVSGEDARVAFARSLLSNALRNGRVAGRDFAAPQLARVRETVLAAVRAEQESAAPACDQGAAKTAGRTAPGMPSDAGPGASS
jgi:hypothetical protein